MIRITDQYFWSFVFSAFFLVIVTMAAIILETESRVPLVDLALVDYVLMTLATWRLTQLFAYDTITRFLREQFSDVKKVGRGYKLEKPKVGPRRVVADILLCPWQLGLLMSSVVIFVYLMTPYAVFPVVLLALSGVVAFVVNLSRLVQLRSEEN